MVAIATFENDAEGFESLSAVEDLARELAVPLEEIYSYYEAALKELRPNAKIKAFLPILAGRQVREIILDRKFRVESANPWPDQAV
jgi:Protein of unknown function (DUF3562)